MSQELQINRTAMLSPCEKICVVDPASGLCRGCGRSLSEIEQWTRYSDAERDQVMAQLPQRLKAMQPHGPSAK